MVALFAIARTEVLNKSPVLGESWDIVSKVISTLFGVVSFVTLIITLNLRSHMIL